MLHGAAAPAPAAPLRPLPSTRAARRAGTVCSACVALSSCVETLFSLSDPLLAHSKVPSLL
eukprot:6185696-Pleurochrysis_carterae.AAC.4